MERRFPAPGTHLCGLTWDGSRLWHSDADTAMIYALDPATGRVRHAIRCPDLRTGLTWTGRLLVQVVGAPKRLCYLRPSGEIVRYRALDPPGERYCGIEASGDQLWLGLKDPGRLQLRDPDSLAVRREFRVEASVAGLTCAPGLVVYASYQDGMIRTVDADTGALLDKSRVAGSPTGLTWDGAQLWYCDYDGREIRTAELAAVKPAADG